jgi:hypothetical protein
MILGSPLYFLHQQAPGAPVSPGQAAPAIVHTKLGLAGVAEKLLALNWHLFPPTLLVLLALLVVFVQRRDLMTMSLIVMIGLNAAFTWLIVVASGAESYLQLRYNMRAMPIALAGVAWLYLLARRRQRIAVWGVTLVALLVSVPVTARTMETFRIQFREAAFVHAVEGRGKLRDQLGGARQAARYVTEHVHRKNAILTDDSETFAAMLLSGRPDLFFDRIDRGDSGWQAALDAPFGKVDYVLVIPGGPDLIVRRYPKIASGGQPGFTPVFRAGKYVLVRVSARPPA